MCNCGGGKRRYYERRYGKRKPKIDPPPVEQESQLPEAVDELGSKPPADSTEGGNEANA